MGQTGLFFSRTISRHHFSSVFTSHNASNSRVSEVPKIVLRFFMMSEKRSTAVENVLFFSKRCIVIRLPVTVYFVNLNHIHTKSYAVLKVM